MTAHVPAKCMRAVVNYAPHDFRFETAQPTPAMPEGGALVKVSRCGICAGDAKCFEGAAKFWGDEQNDKYVQEPIIPGHEFVGDVVEVDDKFADRFGIAVGDQVTCEQVVACQECLYCRKNLRWLCQPHDIFGYHQVVPGGFAQYMAFPAKSLVYKIPKSVEPRYAAYVEPLACGVHGVERAKVEPGDVVVVSGCGAIGLGMIATLKYERNAARIVALDLSDERLDVARACGADVLLNPSKVDVVQQVKDICGGYGCDAYLEASGSPVSVQQGILMCRKAARFVEFSVFNRSTTLDWSLIGDTKELDIFGGHCSGHAGYQEAIDMLTKQSLPVERVVTHDLPLSQCVEGINMVNSGAKGVGSAIKIVLDPWRE